MKALPYACSIWRKVASSRGEIRCGNRQLEDQLHPGAAAPFLAVSFPSSYVQIFLVHHVTNPFEKSKTKVWTILRLVSIWSCLSLLCLLGKQCHMFKKCSIQIFMHFLKTFLNTSNAFGALGIKSFIFKSWKGIWKGFWKHFWSI